MSFGIIIMETKYIFLIIAFILYTLAVYLFSRLGKSREIGMFKLFLISFFLTPILGLAFYLSSSERKINFYKQASYQCDNCGYVFMDAHKYCPNCAKEGIQIKLRPVSKIMT